MENDGDGGGDPLLPYRQLGATVLDTLEYLDLQIFSHIATAANVIASAKIQALVFGNLGFAATLLAEDLAGHGNFPTASRRITEARARAAEADLTLRLCATPLGLDLAADDVGGLWAWTRLRDSGSAHAEEARRVVSAAAAFAAAAEDALRFAGGMPEAETRRPYWLAVAVRHLDSATRLLIAARAAELGLNQFYVEGRIRAEQLLQLGGAGEEANGVNGVNGVDGD